VRICCLLSAILLSVGLREAQAESTDSSKDIVVFVNGDVLTGSISGTTAQVVLFSNDSVGSLSLKWSDLQTVTFRHAIKVATSKSQAGQEFDGGIVSVVHSGDKLDLKVKANPEANPTDLEDVQSINGANRCASGIVQACPGWQLSSAKISVALLEATQTDQTYGGSITSVRNWNPDEQGWPHQRTLLELQANYDDKRKNSKPGSANVTREYDGLLQHLMFIDSDTFFASTVADLYHNNSLGLYLEQSYGAGLGRLWLGTEFDADLRFIGEHFYGANPSRSLVGSQLSEKHTFVLDFIKSGAKLTETAKYTPVFNASSAWQLSGIFDLTIPITKKLQFSSSVSDYYVENASSSYRKNYLKTTIGLEYTPNPKH